MYFEAIEDLTERLVNNMSRVIYGKTDEMRLILAALYCRGHVLLDDIPGTGKTTLAKALAKSIQAQGKTQQAVPEETNIFRRIQFTPDLLPSDITGINIYSQKEECFRFRPGPLFANIILADEINRTTPRTQSALLECMEEFQTTIDGKTYPMKRLFFVIATQNPVESQGTFPLPEAQLDRFLLKLRLGYPDRDNEKKVLEQYIANVPMASVSPVCTIDEILSAQESVQNIHVSSSIKSYAVDIANASRTCEQLRLGVSPRGTLALIRLAQAMAAMDGRDYVLPDDVKNIAIPALAHRVISRSQNAIRMADAGETVISYLLSTVNAPIGDPTAQ